MLILSRRIDEVVHIGDDIEVTVMAINGNQVRLGIKAPRSVVVDREEVANRTLREHVSGLIAEGPASDIEPEATEGSGRPNIRVIRRPVRNEAALTSVLPPTPERGHQSTLRIRTPKSKITGT